MNSKRQKSKRKNIIQIIQFIIGAILIECCVFYFSHGTDVFNKNNIAVESSDSLEQKCIYTPSDKEEQDNNNNIIISKQQVSEKEEGQKEVVQNDTKNTVKPKNSEYDYMVNFIAHLINGEAGCNWCTDEHQQLVGYVFCNRVRSNGFPSTFEAVLNQGYASATDGNFNKKPTQRAYTNAKIVVNNYLSGTIPVPSNLVYQAEFIQGRAIYKQLGNTYFCLK